KHGHDEHGDERDHHIWLDPKNARAMAHEISEVLGATDPDNAARYEANARALGERLDSLTAKIRQTLEPVHERPFIVFHDAYQHFERSFDLKTAGSITVSPEMVPGAERVSGIQRKIKELGATCVFSEPQFAPRLVQVVTQGTAAKSGVLDPLGTEIPNGPDLYFTLLHNMAESIQTCLSPKR
ncbi:MAG TPA: zinc ABC transporter substrate-binding protein, partial [Rhodospirillaceae bacterium]|nr:zinc ABC transporter substrate-binding protein [Rhodospirillaceae bacterium]